MKDIDTIISNYEANLAKYMFVKQSFPDCKVIGATLYPHNPVFVSKSVNQQYTEFKVIEGYRSVSMEPRLEIEFKSSSGEEIIPIYCSPRRLRLAYIDYDRNLTKKIIRFTKIKFNMKNNQVKEYCFNDCRKAILNFVQKNNNIDLDTKLLDPSLKKLLAFI